MRWPWRRRDAPRERGPERGAGDPPVDGLGVEVTVAAAYPPCSQCGSTRFPLVGGWDPPICADCDAAINEDTIQAEEIDR